MAALSYGGQSPLKGCSTALAGSCKTVVPKVAVGPPDDTSPIYVNSPKTNYDKD